MIKTGYPEHKTTPRRFAKECIRNALESAYYWAEKTDTREMTEREIALVDEHVRKIADPIWAKLTEGIK